LHEYWHFDPWGWKDRDDADEFLVDVIEDNVLRTVIEKGLSLGEGKRDGVSYLFGVERG
jgi:hypothetical protein